MTSVRNYVKVSVGGLAIRIPPTPMGLSGAGVHSTSYPFFCEIKVQGLPGPPHVAPVELALASGPPPDPTLTCASFYLNETEMAHLLPGNSSKKSYSLDIDILAGRDSWWGLRHARSLGTLRIPITREWMEPNSVFQPVWGWTSIGKKSKKVQIAIHLHACVKVELDPRHALGFESRAYQSPQIVQVNGGVKQPIFSCKFGQRNQSVSQSNSPSAGSSTRPSFWNLLSGKFNKIERKGWSITVHDLSGSPVAAASMITPFVPSSSGRVGRSNPGAWLIMRNDRTGRSGESSLKPWGRLEAWRERGNDTIGFRFELIGERIISPTGQVLSLVAKSKMTSSHGGTFSLCTIAPHQRKSSIPGLCSPGPKGLLIRRNSIDSATSRSSPEGFGMKRSEDSLPSSSSSSSSSSSTPRPISYSSNSLSDPSMSQHTEDIVMNMEVGRDSVHGGRVFLEVGSKNIPRVDDAAVLVALAAAVELSAEACQQVSKGLRQVLKQLENDDKWDA